MRSLAVVPPVLLDKRERRLCFDNRNGLVEDPMAEYRERPMLNVWSEQVRKTTLSSRTCLRSLEICIYEYTIDNLILSVKFFQHIDF